MIQLEPLWIYQQADLALDRFENGLKKSPTRTKLLNVRNAVMEQQNRIKRLEADLQKALEECNRIAADVRKLHSEMDGLDARMEQCDTEDIGQVRRLLKNMEEWNRALSSMRKELAQAQNLAHSTDATVKEVRAKLTQGKKDFDALKEKYDAELAAAAPERDKLKAEADRLGKEIPQELMARYKKIKKTRMNPVAKVQNEQCGGCNMAIPSLTMSKLRGGETLLECESCGRILYFTEA